MYIYTCDSSNRAEVMWVIVGTISNSPKGAGRLQVKRSLRNGFLQNPSEHSLPLAFILNLARTGPNKIEASRGATCMRGMSRRATLRHRCCRRSARASGGKEFVWASVDPCKPQRSRCAQWHGNRASDVELNDTRHDEVMRIRSTTNIGVPSAMSA